MRLCHNMVDSHLISFVLNFAYAEALEANKTYEEVHATFDKFLEVLKKDLQELEERQSAAVVDASQMSDLSQQSSSSVNSQASDESKSGKNKELSDRRTEYGLAWIVYMRFARRAENLKSARNVFSKARRDKWTPWEVYEAAGKRIAVICRRRRFTHLIQHLWSTTVRKRPMSRCESLRRDLIISRMRSS